MTKPADDSATSPVQDWLRVVQQKVQSLTYGEVHITVHDGQVTQVEQTEKVRFHVTKKVSPKNKV